ncbi:MAG: hypothetical protein ITD33_05565 [Nitrosarchaeum sp.]|nr:hypothetical protein [Nitrosarchaeum sp.]
MVKSKLRDSWMTSCSGCGQVLGFKKYKFNRMWRIAGSYCKSCMLEVGKDFDKHGRLTIPKHECALCHGEFFYLKSLWQEKQQNNYCDVCHLAVSSGAIPSIHKGNITAPVTQKIPVVMAIFAGLGVLMMVLGLVFTLMISPGSDQNIVNIMFGAVTTGLGFVLFRKTMKSRSLLVNKISSEDLR